MDPKKLNSYVGVVNQPPPKWSSVKKWLLHINYAPGYAPEPEQKPVCRQFSRCEGCPYRGVTSYNAKNIKALSWTLDRDTAEWFAYRFGEEGTVYEAQIQKEHILAFFNGRNESEVVVDPKYLEQIMESPEPEIGMRMT